jgi:nucleotide-binding universal stress UspA family protein
MQASEGYPLGQLAKAFVTAVTHADAGTRAEERMRQWRDVLDRGDWPDLARRAFERARALVARVGAQPRGLSLIKDAAYAWRQCLFFLSMASTDDDAEPAAFLAWADDLAAGDHRLTAVLAGLRRVAEGGSLDEDTGPHPFTGWTAGPHWMKPAGVYTIG